MGKYTDASVFNKGEIYEKNPLNVYVKGMNNVL